MIYYHFTGNTLRDGKPIPAIASPDAFDALQYAPGAILHQVELDGLIVAHGSPIDKYAAQKRKIVATIDATDIMRLFARRVALDVIHLWKAPPIVREYLETGDESKRAAAGAAAWAAARDAARDAARAAKEKLYRGWFNEMVEAAFAIQTVSKRGAERD